MKIFRKISYSEIARLAVFLEDERLRETEAGLEALVHAIRNRSLSGEHFSNILRDINTDRFASVNRPASFDILSMIASVFNEGSIDPTDGAVRFHRHDELPDWAKSEQPTALIGGRFYYP